MNNGFSKKYYIIIAIAFAILLVVMYLCLLYGIPKFNEYLTLFFSLMVALSTIIYALLTANLVTETRKAREAQFEPRLAVYIQPRDEYVNFVDAVIENVGTGSAENIKLSFDKDIKCLTGVKLSEFGAFKEGIQYLSPGKTRSLFVIHLLNDENYINMQINIKAEFNNYLGTPYNDSFLLNYSEFTHYLPPQSGLFEIKDELVDIKKAVEGMNNKMEVPNKIKQLEKKITNFEEELLSLRALINQQTLK